MKQAQATHKLEANSHVQTQATHKLEANDQEQAQNAFQEEGGEQAQIQEKTREVKEVKTQQANIVHHSKINDKTTINQFTNAMRHIDLEHMTVLPVKHQTLQGLHEDFNSKQLGYIDRQSREIKVHPNMAHLIGKEVKFLDELSNEIIILKVTQLSNAELNQLQNNFSACFKIQNEIRQNENQLQQQTNSPQQHINGVSKSESPRRVSLEPAKSERRIDSKVIMQKMQYPNRTTYSLEIHAIFQRAARKKKLDHIEKKIEEKKLDAERKTEEYWGKKSNDLVNFLNMQNTKYAQMLDEIKESLLPFHDFKETDENIKQIDQFVTNVGRDNMEEMISFLERFHVPPWVRDDTFEICHVYHRRLRHIMKIVAAA